MISILEELKKGNAEIAASFRSCVEYWGTLLSNANDLSVEELAEEISTAQFKFEQIVGSRYLGKTIMAYSGFTYLYNEVDGLSENNQLALKLSAAFGHSTCSIEVKSIAKKAAKLYSIDGYA